MIRWFGLLAAIVVLAGCGTPPPPEPQPPQPRTLRGVRPAGGLALSYLHIEPASQALCAALPADLLQQVLDARWVQTEPDISGMVASCTIKTDAMVVDLLLGPDRDFLGGQKIGGRPAEVRGTDIRVAVSDRPGHRTTGQLLRVLRVTGHGAADAEQVRLLVNALVAVLSKQTDPMPAIGVGGVITFVATPLDKAFIDLPKPVQALQLCTVLQDKFGYEVFRVVDAGVCAVTLTDGRTPLISTVGAEQELSAYTGPKVAGRPTVSSDTMLRIRLRDEIPVDLAVGPGDKDVVEKLVPLLLQG